MKRLVLLLSILTSLTTACQPTEVKPEGQADCDLPPMSCIDPTKIKDGPCTKEYELVCGCNGQTYANTCLASNAGVQYWTKGPCPTKNN
ncbi:kazal domain protein [Hymenobacter lucidus]|uniref:Kazal domain protein n=1 Tax=Hymenobacter lucidus TaxID=2880930 RepID=A0ABS8AQC0_9BACT|nr:kazal domain protein [Hymenobacter lucidus]MCB2408410.1 kazal domain protein [Hymenobacter lucidus]